MHHALSDGHGMMQLLSQAHSRSPEPGPPVKRRSRKPAAPLPSTATVLGQQLRAGLSRLPQQARTLAADVAQGLQRPGAAQEALRYARSAARILGRKPAPKSPLLAGRSLDWHFDALDFPLDAFKVAAKRSGASLNDAYIAGIAGGFRRVPAGSGAITSSSASRSASCRWSSPSACALRQTASAATISWAGSSMRRWMNPIPAPA